MYAIIKIAINIYSGTLFIEMAMGWSQYASVIGLVGKKFYTSIFA